MKAGTWASDAPGVSVGGMIRSTSVATHFISEGRKILGVYAALIWTGASG